MDDAGTTASAQLKGTIGGNLDPNTGRGEAANLTFPNDPNSTCLGGSHGFCTYAYYIVNQQEMILISADTVTNPAYLTLWLGSRQTQSANGWTLQALTGSSVIELNAVEPAEATQWPT